MASILYARPSISNPTDPNSHTYPATDRNGSYGWIIPLPFWVCIHNPQLGAVLVGIGYGRFHLGQKKVLDDKLLSIYSKLKYV